MNAKKYLMRLWRIESILTNRLEDIKRWKERAESITCQPTTQIVEKDGKFIKTIIPPTSSGSVSDKVGTAVCEYVDLENDATIKALFEEKKSIIANIEKVDNILQYEILFKRYALQKDFKQIAIELDKSYSQITTAHGEALKQMQRILDEILTK